MEKFNDFVVVLGPSCNLVDRVEALCKEVGIKCFYVRKESDPEQRIDLADDSGVLGEDFRALVSETVFCFGVLVPEGLYEAAVVDCNLSSEKDIFEDLGRWIDYRTV